MPSGREAAEPAPRDRYVSLPLTGPLDEFTYPTRLNPGAMTVAQNVMWRRLGAVGKRTGSGLYGSYGTVGTGRPVISGYRWYQGVVNNVAAPQKQLIVQSNDALYIGNDGTGHFTLLGNLTAGSTSAFFTSCFDPTNTAGVNPNTDVMIVAYGSGQPMKWDGTDFNVLSASITNLFTGTTFWHNHVWFWGDPNTPSTLWATDLGNPEGFTFMNSFAPPGYQIGQGDGDPLIQRVIGVGPFLYVFKSASIQMVQGYDFTSGEYQFSVQPWVETRGTSSPHSVARLRDNVIYWTGSNYEMLQPGNNTPIPIGTKIINQIAGAAAGSQSIMRAVAGDFIVQGPYGNFLYTNVYICAVDDGSGVAQKLLVYDDDASQFFGQPAWSVWQGLKGGCFIPIGPQQGDPKTLYMGDAVTDTVRWIGQNASADNGAAINVMIQTKTDDAGTPDQNKVLDRVYLELQSGNASFLLLVYGEGVPTETFAVTSVPLIPGSTFGSGVFGSAIFGSANVTAYQVAIATLSNAVTATNFIFSLSESSSTSLYEIVGLTYHAIEEAVNL